MPEVDLCVYGGTAGGVIAAIAAAPHVRSVLLVEPGRHLGGMSGGGLGQTDTGNKAAIGGMSREFYRRVGRHYGREEAWTFEPHVAERIYRDWIAESRVRVLFEHRLAEASVERGRLTRILLENVPADPTNAPGRSTDLREHVQIEARMFIDASYEGDLLAAANVPFTVGRESSAKYGESLNGVRAVTPKHQFLVPVDPYLRPGDPSSGLLPLIQHDDGSLPGQADSCVQAYNFRLCFTRKAENRIPIGPPPGYQASTFEVLARHLDGLKSAGRHVSLAMLMNINSMPRGKTDINNNGAVSTDFIGQSRDWPTGSYDRRREIWLDHLRYTQGLIHFIATDPRVPAEVRRAMSEWGLCRDEFTDTAGWPCQLYVREGRRMVSPYVITQAVCEHRQTVHDSVGLASYNMDSHNCRRIVQNGVVRNEGDVQAPPAGPYPVAYRALTPPRESCGNLLVPVCLSASHIAYGSVRMEPVFMLLGEAAGVAASMALRDRCAVQDIDVASLQRRLREGGQVLEWSGHK